MATLLHHIQPWMQRYIGEAEERLEKKIIKHTERKVMEVHQRFNAFELRVLVRPAPTVDVASLPAAMESLRAELDTILEARVPESKSPSAKPTEDTVLAALFSTATLPLRPP